MCVAATTTLPADDRVILPTHVKPKHYRLTLTPNLVDFTFDGTVDVDLDVCQETDTIVVNAKELHVHSAHVVFSAGKSQQSYVHFSCFLFSILCLGIPQTRLM